MDRDEFQRVVSADPQLAGPVRRAAEAGGPKQFGGMAEAAALALVFPLVCYVLTHVGLPWLHAGKRFSDLYLAKVHRWIDQRCRQAGFDPDAMEAAADALCAELQSIADADARAAWERLAARFRPPEEAAD